MQQRIGILGGTFNPVHTGHLIIAQHALEQVALDTVVFVPCANPYHKATDDLAEAGHRLAMLETAVSEDPRFEVSRADIDRGGDSYSVDTVADTRRRHPDARIEFIIGTDSLLELHTWKNVYDLLESCPFITMARPGFRVEDPGQLHLRPPWPEKLLGNVMMGRVIDISSSEIRRRVREGKSIRYLVPEGVEGYIRGERLYGR